MPWKEEPKLPTTTTVVVKEGQYATLPNAPHKAIIGPAKLAITRFPTGGVDGQVLSGEIVDAAVVVQRRLERVGW